MAWGEVGWLIFLAGLPFASFLNKNLDLWHTQALWAQQWLGLLALYGIGTGTVHPIPNKPLAWWMGWVGTVFFGTWVSVLIREHKYDLSLLPYAFHFLCLLLFYWLATGMWTKAFLLRLLRVLAYVGIVLVAYGLLQWANLDQFFRPNTNQVNRDYIVGTIGNPTHFASVLALYLPIFLTQREWWWYVIAVLAGAVLLATQSASGIAVAVLVSLWTLYFRNRKAFLILLPLAVVVALASSWLIPKFLDTSGRLDAWAYYWQFAKQRPITGAGLGFVMQASRFIANTSHPLYHWRHTHCEPLQLMIEQGVIGLAFVLWGLVEVIRRARPGIRLAPERVACVGILGGFCLLSLVNFPAHLWQLSALGLLAYSGIYVSTAKES